MVGAGIEVHRELGCGFAEAIYQEAMQLELGWRGIPFECGKKLEARYKGRALQKWYVADLLCYGLIIVEIKAQDRLYPRDESQILNYLKVSGMKLGLLLNFGFHGKLEWKRLVMTRHGAIDPDEPLT